MRTGNCRQHEGIEEPFRMKWDAQVIRVWQDQVQTVGKKRLQISCKLSTDDGQDEESQLTEHIP
jgi:hypothetical protein